MADFYPYLIASLPMLHFGMKPPFSFERFLEVCYPFIPEKDFQLLSMLPQPEQYSEKSKRHQIVQKWIEFDVALRNELVRIRATKKHIEPAMYLCPDGIIGSSLAPAVMAATLNVSIPDAEKILDEIRWKALEELATGHYFDLVVLIAYAYKLLILLRWENIRSADGSTLLEQALQH
ncbi:MAG: DUF2764 domain-containing protein [Methanoregula sp.]|jgi:hypothetical protein|nr:DUF2764 domain-containing protein [Methanoregula sp.]